ncbi:DUF2878 domain-containing protein [Algibacillus agarilyticus]|uniref:DUF2878 domain-containing protein n=1 Tax=Algibacillus agarilyticus TaxID=2234133 RepID=UPI000DCF700B|nr:DUF2878 domain-containing protein [Algibacillus agarilyticus]
MILNIIGFQICWFGLLYWENAFIPIAMVLVAFHLIFYAKKYSEWLLILSVTLLGILVDSALYYFEFYIFNNESRYIPIWLGVMWACFACTLCHSLSFLKSSKYLQVGIGGGLAPFSYIAASQFDAVTLGYELVIMYGVLAVIWSVLFLLFYYLSAQFTLKGY